MLETTRPSDTPARSPRQQERGQREEAEAPTLRPPPPDTPKAVVKEAEETVEVVGKKVKCKTTETTLSMGEATSWMKTWTSAEVPGELVKFESKLTGVPGAESSSKTVLVEWKSP